MTQAEFTFRDTRLASWEAIQAELPGRQAEVFQVIARAAHGMALYEIAETLALPINCITGRVRELVKAGRVRDSGTRRLNPRTGKHATLWEVA